MIRLILAFLFCGSLAFAETDPAQIALRAAAMLEAAGAELEAAEKSRDRVTALTQTVRAYEEGLTALRTGLRQAAIRELSLTLALKAKEDRVSQLLGVLSSLERTPRPLLLLHPSGPLDTARSGMMLSGITPSLQKEVDTLRAELEELRVLQALQRSASESLAVGLNGIQTARTALSQAIAERTDLPRRVTEDPAIMMQLLETADTLDAFAAGLSGAPQSTQADFGALKGQLPLPGPARLLRGFNQPDAAGISRPGLLLALEPGALITAPAAATLRYAGPLLDYGNVIILEPEEGVLLVLAGLDIVYGQAGDVLASGAPLGLMGGFAQTQSDGTGPQDGTFRADREEVGGGGRSETLYMELRQGEAPVDPTEWFTETKDG